MDFGPDDGAATLQDDFLSDSVATLTLRRGFVGSECGDLRSQNREVWSCMMYAGVTPR
jgi:hypothetical protein